MEVIFSLAIPTITKVCTIILNGDHGFMKPCKHHLINYMRLLAVMVLLCDEGPVSFNYKSQVLLMYLSMKRCYNTSYCCHVDV